MTHKNPGVAWQLRTGRPVEVEEITLTPVSRRLLLRWNGGGFVWQFPVAVLVEEEGEETHLPVPDVTRIAWLALVAATLMTLVILALLRAQDNAQKEKMDETRS